MGFKHLFKHTIWIQRQLSTNVDKWGEGDFGEQFSMKVAYSKKFIKILDTQGEEAISEHQLRSSVEIGLKDRVWLPGTDRTVVSEAKVPQNIGSADSKIRSLTLYQTFF